MAPRESHRPVIGYEGVYTIGDQGTVTRIECGAKRRPIKAYGGSNGYLQVRLWRNGCRRTVRIHRMVAEAFLGPRPTGLTVNHKDGDKINNCVGNLEYVTSGENTRHAIRLGISDPSIGGRASAGIGYKLDREDVDEIRIAVAAGEKHADVAARYGIYRGTVGHIVHRRIWK